MIPKSHFSFSNLLVPHSSFMRIIIEDIPRKRASFIEIINALLSGPLVILSNDSREALIQSVKFLLENNTGSDTKTDFLSDFCNVHKNLVADSKTLFTFFNIILAARSITISNLTLEITKEKSTENEQLAYFEETTKRIFFMIDIANIIIKTLENPKIIPSFHAFFIAIYSDFLSNLSNITAGLYEPFFNAPHFPLLRDTCEKLIRKIDFFLNTLSCLKDNNSITLEYVSDHINYLAFVASYQIAYHYIIKQDKKAEALLKHFAKTPSFIQQYDIAVLLYRSTLQSQVKMIYAKIKDCDENTADAAVRNVLGTDEDFIAQSHDLSQKDTSMSSELSQVTSESALELEKIFSLEPFCVVGTLHVLDLDHLNIHTEKGELVLPRAMPYKSTKIVSKLKLNASAHFFELFKTHYAALSKDNALKINLSSLQNLWITSQIETGVVFFNLSIPIIPLMSSLIGARACIIEKNTNIFSLDQNRWISYFKDIESRVQFMIPLANMIAIQLAQNLEGDYVLDIFSAFLTIILDDTISTLHNIANGLLYNYFTQDHFELSALCQRLITIAEPFYDAIRSSNIELHPYHTDNLFSLICALDLYKIKYYYAIGQDQTALKALQQQKAVIPEIWKQYQSNKQTLKKAIAQNTIRTLYSTLLQLIHEDLPLNTNSVTPNYVIIEHCDSSTQDLLKELSTGIVFLKQAHQNHYKNSESLASCEKITELLLKFFKKDPHNILCLYIQHFLTEQLAAITKAQGCLDTVNENSDNSSQAEYTVTESHAAKLKKRFQTLQQQNQQLQTAHNKASLKANKEISKTRGMLETAQTRQSTLIEKLSLAQSSVQSTQLEVSLLQKTGTELQKRKAAHESQVKSSQKQVIKLENEIKPLTKQQQELTQTKTQLEAEYHSIQETILVKKQSYEQSIQTLEMTNTGHQIKQEQLREKIKALQSSLEQANSAYQATLEAIEGQHTHSHAALEKELNTLTQEQQHLLRQNQILQAHCYGVQQTLSNALAQGQIANQHNLQEAARWQANISGFCNVVHTMSQYFRAQAIPFVDTPPPVASPSGYLPYRSGVFQTGQNPQAYTMQSATVPLNIPDMGAVRFTPIVNLTASPSMPHF